MKINKKLIGIFLAVTAIIGIGLIIGMTIAHRQAENERAGKLDISRLYKVNIYGTEGEGYVDIELDEGYFEAYIIESGISILKTDIVVEVDKPNNLSNGDVFTVSFKDLSLLESKGVRILKSKVSYTVDNLKDGTDYNVFADLVVYCKDGQLIFDDSHCANFIKDNVDFYIKDKRDTYKEGDTILVGAYVDMNAATDNGYRIEKIEENIIITEQEKTND